MFAQTDTELHMEYTAAISSGSGLVCQRVFGLGKVGSFACGVGAGVLVGVGKEVLDSRQPNNFFSGHDIKNDIIGSLVGAMAYRFADDVIISPIFKPKDHFIGLNLNYKI